MKILHLANPMSYAEVGQVDGDPLDPQALVRTSGLDETIEVVLVFERDGSIGTVWVAEENGDRSLPEGAYGFKQYATPPEDSWGSSFDELENFLQTKGRQPNGRRYLRRILHGPGFIYQTLAGTR